MEANHDKTRTHAALTPGMPIGRYRIVRSIGVGGMGEVHLAEDTELSRPVALKFLPPHLSEDEDCRKRFKREAQAAARLDHPNIVTVYEVGEHEGRPFFAMQHVEGRTLRDHASGRDLSIPQVLEIGIQVCEGLQAAHEKGITHRDIKPANVLIDALGRARIVDFGLAAVQGGEQLTRTGSTLGTIGYMSPEQVRGGQIDRRTDLFSLGVVLYELLTGHSPFRRDSDAATLHAITHDQPPPPGRYRRDTSDGLQAILDKALEKDAALRYQSAADLLTDLRREMRSRESGVTSARQIFGSVRQRRRWWGYAVGGAVIVAAIVWAGSSLRLGEPKTAVERQPMLVVLPFENLGSPDDEYFAEGIAEEIMARLAGVRGLGVIARTSAKQYKNTEKTVAQIARELNVDYILEGTVRWDKAAGTSGRVRVTPQLIRVADESHVWASVFDRTLTEIFDVQSSIANEVVSALRGTFGRPEREVLAAAPTRSVEAYDHYLRGRHHFSNQFKEQGVNHGLAAIAEFTQAEDLDSNFVEPVAMASWAHAMLYWLNYDRSSKRVELAGAAAARARAIAANHPMTRLAQGFYAYYCEHDYQHAAAEFHAAMELAPNSADALVAAGWINRRLGLWEESLALQQQALKLDPLNELIRENLVGTARVMRRFALAEQLIDEGLSLAPHDQLLRTHKAGLILAARGDAPAARRILGTFAPPVAPGRLGQMLDTWVLCLTPERNFDSVLVLFTRLVNREDYESPFDIANYYAIRAKLCWLAGRKHEGRVFDDSARILVEGFQHDGGGEWGYGNPPPPLGPIYARLGRTADAIAIARRQADLVPVSRDAYHGFGTLSDLARTYAIVGEPERAIELLDSLLSIPSLLTVPLLRVDPAWDPIRDHPAFQQLLKKHARDPES